jgi:mono/diheme cytochrome c family protein
MKTSWTILGITIALCGVAARSVGAEKAATPTGEEIYQHICQGCHMPDGRGAQGAGAYPALAGNPKLASAHFTASTIYHGRHNMPHFGPQPDLGEFEAFVTMHLDDEEIAAVVNYVRSHFGNHYTDELTAKDIAALHPESQPHPKP